MTVWQFLSLCTLICWEPRINLIFRKLRFFLSILKFTFFSGRLYGMMRNLDAVVWRCVTPWPSQGPLHDLLQLTAARNLKGSGWRGLTRCFKWKLLSEFLICFYHNYLVRKLNANYRYSKLETLIWSITDTDCQIWVPNRQSYIF